MQKVGGCGSRPQSAGAVRPRSATAVIPGRVQPARSSNLGQGPAPGPAPLRNALQCTHPDAIRRRREAEARCVIPNFAVSRCLPRAQRGVTHSPAWQNVAIQLSLSDKRQGSPLSARVLAYLPFFATLDTPLADSHCHLRSHGLTLLSPVCSPLIASVDILRDAGIWEGVMVSA